jgi:SAM-dependent methyltransferase
MSTSYMPDHSWGDERARLAAIAGVYDKGTVRILDEIGVGPGWSCLEVGAGHGSVAEWLAARVGPTGDVLAVDLDARFLAESHVLRVRTHDITTGAPEPGAFDLAHARLVIEWIADREAALRAMVDALKPGGWLCVEDFDVDIAAIGATPGPMRAKAIAAMNGLAAAVGAELTFGRRLLPVVEALGLVDIDVDARTTVHHGGPDGGMEFERLTVAQFGQAFVGAGLLTADELTAVYADLDDPAVIAYAPLMVAVWGRKPG